jgi:DNA-binding transcriptional LysR family regulator
MKIEAFAVLDAVLRHGSLTGAAREVGLTASAVSIQMKQLEIFFGQQLFDRSGFQIQPLSLAQEVSSVRRRAHAELAGLRRHRGLIVEGNVELGLIDILQPRLLPKTMRLLEERYPALRVHVRRGRSADLTRAVKAGEIDCAVVAQPDRGGARLGWHPIFDCPLSLLVPPEETSEDLSVLFSRYKWIRYDPHTIAGKAAARYINARVRDRRLGMELDSVRSIASVVSAGLGISLVQLSDPGICLPFQVRVVTPPQAPLIRFSFVSRTADADSRQIGAVRDAILAAAGER